MEDSTEQKLSPVIRDSSSRRLPPLDHRRDRSLITGQSFSVVGSSIKPAEPRKMRRTSSKPPLSKPEHLREGANQVPRQKANLTASSTTVDNSQRQPQSHKDREEILGLQTIETHPGSPVSDRAMSAADNERPLY